MQNILTLNFPTKKIKMFGKLTYKKSGVNIGESDKFVKSIMPIARKTFNSRVLKDIGFFSAFYKLNVKDFKEPVLVSSTDGVGTKLKIAFMMDKHDTVGIDLVAMCVNDIITCGAKPLFFLDYFATGRLNYSKAMKVIKGIVKGCQEAGCSLIGGETAEMPGFYHEDEYDLSGFAVGIVEKKGIIDGSSIKQGDVIIGCLSNGLHSNGFSLVRKLFFEMEKMDVRMFVPEIGSELGHELLKPTRLYVKALNALKEEIKIKGMANITGGGIPGNLPRILSDGLYANISLSSWEIPPIFNYIKKIGKISDKEMFKTFNMGVGFIFIISEKDAIKALSTLKACGYDSNIIGIVKKGGNGVRFI